MSLRSYCVPLDPNSHLYRSLPVFNPALSLLSSRCTIYFGIASHTFLIVRLLFFSSSSPAKLSPFLLHQAWIVTRVLPATNSAVYSLSIYCVGFHHDFSFVYICMETLGSSGRMPAPTAARFTIFSFSSRFACAR